MGYTFLDNQVMNLKHNKFLESFLNKINCNLRRIIKNITLDISVRLWWDGCHIWMRPELRNVFWKHFRKCFPTQTHLEFPVCKCKWAMNWFEYLQIYCSLLSAFSIYGTNLLEPWRLLGFPIRFFFNRIIMQINLFVLREYISRLLWNSLNDNFF